MEASIILDQYASKHNIEVIATDDAIIRFRIEETTLIAFEETLNGDGFFMYGVVASADHNQAKEMALSALKGNLFGAETGPTTLGYCEKTGAFVLFQRLEYSKTDYPAFCKHFEQFLRYYFHWTEAIHHPERMHL